MSAPYSIPAQNQTVELEFSRSRFVVTIYQVDTVESAKATIARHRLEFSSANHHVYAFRVGFGNSVTEGLSDDGEPTGTAGPPVLSVLRGSSIGDTLVIVTRYFGGVLLGTGGLVRAYSETAALAIKTCPTKLKIQTATMTILIEYQHLDGLKRALPSYSAEIIEEVYTDTVGLGLRFPSESRDGLVKAIVDLTAGNVYIDEPAR